MKKNSPAPSRRKTSRPAPAGAAAAVPPLQKLTRGHFRLMQRMGLAMGSSPAEGESPEQWQARMGDTLSVDQRSDEGSAFLWLLTRPIEDLKPGGSAYQAIADGQWRELVEAWEFELDEAAVAAYGVALARMAGR